jgi:hypothetical protein
MKAVHVLGILVVAGVIAAPISSARPNYFAQVVTQFKLTKDGKPSISCQYCHQDAKPAKSWNGFGTRFAGNLFGAANKDIAQALYLTLKERKDSDEDGYDDVLEVLSGSRPGDAKSKPKTPKDTLEAELKMWGGVDYFKPKK